MLTTENTYNYGDWIKSKNAYYKNCPTRKQDFFCSYRKTYCDNKCKEKFNNDKAKINRDKEKIITSPIMKNIKILEFFHSLNNDGQQIPIIKLKENGFDSSIFLKSIKDKNGNEWFAIHNYAYRILDSTHLTITKIN